jgi:renin receptor
MAKSYLFPLLTCLLVVQCIDASTQGSTLSVVAAPPSLRLSDETYPIDGSSIADFVSLTLGYSLPTAFQWRGLSAITDVFSLPTTAVTLRLVGQHDIPLPPTVARVPIDGPLDSERERRLLWQRTEQRFEANERLFVRMEDANLLDTNLLVDSTPERRLSDAFNRKELQELVTIGDKSDANIKAFVLELETVYQILDSLKTTNADLRSLRGLFWLEMRAFDRILSDDKYEESVRTLVTNLVAQLIQKLTQELDNLYDHKVLVAVIEERPQESPQLVRKTRDTKAAALNLAHEFDPNFHSAFAVTAFTSVVLAVVVYGVAVAMWHVDPGKDSIIYRMTSQRIKKDQ